MEKKRFVFGLSIGMLLIAAAAILLYWILNGQKEEAAQEGMLVQQTLVQTAEDDAEEALCFLVWGNSDMSSSATVYLKIPQKVLLTEPQANLGQVGTVWCEDKALAARCMALRVCSFQEGVSELRSESLIEVIKKIQQMAPGTQVQNLGETEFLLVYEPEKKRKIADLVKTAGIVIVLFCGAAFSILTFNQDVDVSKVLDTLYELVTGSPSVGTTWMEIGYAIGLPLGIFGFYNHFSKKKKLGDPTPLQVQMRQYEKNVNQTVLENDSRRKGDSA